MMNTQIPWGVSLLFLCVLLFSGCHSGQVVGIAEKEASLSTVSSSSTPANVSVRSSLVARSSSRSSVPQVPSLMPPTVSSFPQYSATHAIPDYSRIIVELRKRIYLEAVLRKELRDLAFGKQAWAQYFGGVDVGEEPPLPLRIINILDGPCPFWEGQKIRDTHLLVLIPSTIDGERFTLNKLGKLIKKKFPHNEKGYRCYNLGVQKKFGNMSLSEASYWLLMTRKVLPGSMGKRYADQQAIVNRYRNHAYRLPYGLEAATSILAYYVRSGERKERLFGDNPAMYTRCINMQLVDTHCPLVVGDFESAGLNILYYMRIGHDDIGVSCCRKL